MRSSEALALVRERPDASPPAPPVPAPPQPPARAVVVERLVKEYHTSVGLRRVLEGISFQVREREKIAVLGRNGSGKSTLIRLLGGVESPTSGTIRREMSLSWPLAIGFQWTICGPVASLDAECS